MSQATKPQIVTRQIITKARETVDQIALEVYGRTPGATEAIFDANPALEAAPVVLPAGLVLNLPTIEAAVIAKTVRLWD